jgi:CelD/BcsL family acetyltransferase involved in cellulose biosynthesis
MSALTVREYMSLDEVSAPQWEKLAARPPASLSGSRAWVEAAFLVQHPDAVPLLVAIESETEIVALLPLAVHQTESGRIARFAAAPRNDLADLLVLPKYAGEAARLAVDALRSIASRGIRIDLEAVDPAGTLAAAGLSGALSWSTGDAAPVIDLRGGAWQASLSIRRRRRWAAKLDALWSADKIRFRRINGSDVALELPEFMKLREMRLNSTGRVVDRLRDASIQSMIEALTARGAVAIMQLAVDTEVVAADLYLLEQPVAMLRLRALDPAVHRLECGHLLLRATAEALAAEGYETLDLGRGEEPYKFVFGAQQRVLLRATLGPPSSQEIG